MLSALALVLSAPASTAQIDLSPLPPFPPASSGRCVQFEPINPPIPWDEAIISWNVKNGGFGTIKFEARVVNEEARTKWYTLGLWSLDTTRAMRTSFKGQADENGDVLTDTLRLTKPGGTLEVRAFMTTLPGGPRPQLTLACVSFSARETAAPAESDKRLWGRSLDVPPRSQMSYKDGDKLCSPTAVSMLLAYWASALNRPYLDRDVPQVLTDVQDPGWPGAGNWPFNTAYLGSFPELTAYVTRFTSISDLERWIGAGVPIACSVDRLALEAKPEKPSGHIVVVRGFTAEGDVMVNDPGWSKEVRQTYKRANFEKAWLYSRRTVYLVHPTGMPTP